jgi:CubicO group peptidase (beta-lactamase class C family)
MVALLLAAAGCGQQERVTAPRMPPETSIRATRGMPLPDEMVLPWMEYHGIPGLSIAVAEGDSIHWARGYGVLDSSTGAPVTSQSVFQAASISKPVAAATALLVLQASGVGLDEDVTPHLASWRLAESALTAWAPVTPRRLLSHSAGINVHGFAGYDAGQLLPSLLQTLRGTKPANNEPIRVTVAPGTRWVYSGGGYQVAQQLAEDLAGGEPFDSLARRLILEPSGMAGSSYLDPLQAEAAAAAHDDRGRPLPGRWKRYPETAAAGLWATPTDLARFAIELQRSHRGAASALVPPELAKEMFAPVVPTGTAGESMGLGIFLGANGTFFHNGGNPGYRCSMVARLDGRLTLVMMTNSEVGDRIFLQIQTALQAVY